MNSFLLTLVVTLVDYIMLFKQMWLSYVFSPVAPQPEVQTLSTVTVSESSSSSVRVSWAPLLPHLIQAYQVEYSALPSGPLRVITLSNRQDSLVLTDLQPDTQYLVTISARQNSGKERAMSVKACTQEGKDKRMCYACHYKCFPFPVK